MYEQLEFDLDFDVIPFWDVYNRMDGRRQRVQAPTARHAVLIAYAVSVGRAFSPWSEILHDYADEITYDFCRVRLGDWCVGI